MTAPELIERFGTLMRENVNAGEIPFYKAWLQTIVDRIDVDQDVIRIVGDKANLKTAIASGSNAAVLGIRSSVRKWRASPVGNRTKSLRRWPNGRRS